MATEGSGGVVCRICGVINPPGTTACPECGSAFPPPGAARFVICAACGGVNPAEARFCNHCGSAFPRAGGAPPPHSGFAPPEAPLPTAIAPPPAMPVWTPETSGTTPIFDSETATARRRTLTGLSLMVVAFVLIWIPYVNYLADLLMFIGIIFLLLGRWGFDNQHHAFVVGGAVFLLILLIVGFIAGLAFIASVAGDAQSSMTASQLTSALQGQVDAFFVATMVLGSLSAFAYLLMPYGLADGWTRTILWVAFIAQVLVSVVVLAVALPLANSAISQATSGATFDVGPINNLETTAQILGLIMILPSLLFAWGYYRARTIALVRS